MYLIVASIVFVWIFILFLDTIFKSCLFYPYIRGLYTAGIEIKPLAIHWKISRYNRYINRMGFYRPWFVKTWFQVGAIVTSAIFFPCLCTYILHLHSLFSTNSSEALQSSKLVFVIPGYNLPFSYWKLYGCVLIVVSVIHEFGHALAASRLGISVDSFGFAWFIFAPIAFVSLRLDRFRHPWWEQLCVFCAGIWHNIVLSLSCVFILNYFVLLVSPLYHIGGGVKVLHVNKLSAVNHPVIGLVPGEQIYALSNCEVKDSYSWNTCLQDMQENPRGLCIPKNFFNNESAAAEVEKRLLARRLVNLEDLTETIPLEKCIEQPDQLYFYAEVEKYKLGICLRARYGVRTYKVCAKSSECGHHSLCGLPHLPQAHRLIIIERDPTYKKLSILYVGTVNELSMDVKVTEFVPRWKWLSPHIPETIKEFLEYLVLFSNGLICLNVLPFFPLDGQAILQNLINILFSSFISNNKRIILNELIKIIMFSVISALFVITSYRMYNLYI